MKTHSLL